MNTSLALVALAYVTQAAFIPEKTPRLQTDYGLAAKQGQKEGKPLAVFVGNGSGGWEKLCKDGKLGKEAKDYLFANYVCLYVDTTDRSGQELARAFKIHDGPGLVISDRTGELQAFRHAGTLSATDVERYLRRYADPKRVVQTTESADTTRSSSATQSSTSYSPSSYYSPPMSGFGGGRGGC